MRQVLLTILIAATAIQANGQFIKIKKPSYNGMYFQWGYNRDWYSKSDIQFKGSNYDFTIYDVRATDQPDFAAFKNNPIDITIPQNSYRIGFYLNKERTHAIEINYDHAKYVMRDYETLRVKGQIRGNQIDKDTFVHRHFAHVDHTNGANFYMINYVGQKELLANKNNGRRMATVIWKLGGGIVVPRSDVIVLGEQLDNKFHVAGYVLGAEGGLRFYPLKNLFLEATLKGGFANYLNSLGVGDGKLKHHFFYGEVIGMVGYDINIGMKKKRARLEAAEKLKN
ncbi:MAG: hypothetical protein R2800_02445 [Flavipsychrobacter sp.]